ncbi:MAG: FkbM family methyltransferase [Patescibacteria group bacterium]|nr:FkbM family methyltransferase [Patescibacteria group bacterium]
MNIYKNIHVLNGLLRKYSGLVKKRLSPQSFTRPTFDSPRLRSFFDSLQIELLDVGARGGPLPPLRMLAPYAHLILCEADVKEAKFVAEELRIQGQWKKLTVMPETLGSGAAGSTLHATRRPGLSSLYAPDRAVVERFYASQLGPKVFRRNWEVVDHIPVSPITLNTVAVKYNLHDISFIKLDTQGTELDILRSGERVVLPSLVAIYLEMEFLPFYTDQRRC